MSHTLYRFSEHRGAHFRLDDPENAVHLSRLRGRSPELDELAPSLPWHDPKSFEYGKLEES